MMRVKGGGGGGVSVSVPTATQTSWCVCLCDGEVRKLQRDFLLTCLTCKVSPVLLKNDIQRDVAALGAHARREMKRSRDAREMESNRVDSDQGTQALGGRPAFCLNLRSAWEEERGCARLNLVLSDVSPDNKEMCQRWSRLKGRELNHEHRGLEICLKCDFQFVWS